MRSGAGINVETGTTNQPIALQLAEGSAVTKYLNEGADLVRPDGGALPGHVAAFRHMFARYDATCETSAVIIKVWRSLLPGMALSCPIACVQVRLCVRELF